MRSTCGTKGAAQWLVVMGPPPPSGPACKILSRFQQLPVCAKRARKARGQSRPFLGLSDLPSCVFPFLTVPLSPVLSAAFWVCVGGGEPHLGAWRSRGLTGNVSQRRAWGSSQVAQASVPTPRVREAP